MYQGCLSILGKRVACVTVFLAVYLPYRVSLADHIRCSPVYKGLCLAYYDLNCRRKTFGCGVVAACKRYENFALVLLLHLGDQASPMP